MIRTYIDNSCDFTCDWAFFDTCENHTRCDCKIVKITSEHQKNVQKLRVCGACDFQITYTCDDHMTCDVMIPPYRGSHNHITYRIGRV